MSTEEQKPHMVLSNVIVLTDFEPDDILAIELLLLAGVKISLISIDASVMDKKWDFAMSVLDVLAEHPKTKAGLESTMMHSTRYNYKRNDIEWGDAEKMKYPRSRSFLQSWGPISTAVRFLRMKIKDPLQMIILRPVPDLVGDPFSDFLSLPTAVYIGYNARQTDWQYRKLSAAATTTVKLPPTATRSPPTLPPADVSVAEMLFKEFKQLYAFESFQAFGSFNQIATDWTENQENKITDDMTETVGPEAARFGRIVASETAPSFIRVFRDAARLFNRQLVQETRDALEHPEKHRGGLDEHSRRRKEKILRQCEPYLKKPNHCQVVLADFMLVAALLAGAPTVRTSAAGFTLPPGERGYPEFKPDAEGDWHTFSHLDKEALFRFINSLLDS